MFYSRRCLNFPGSITVFVVVRWILFHAGFYCFREIMIQIKGRQAQDGGHCQRCCRALPASAHLVACLREMGRWCSPPTRRMIEVASVAAVDVAADAKATSATAAKAIGQLRGPWSFLFSLKKNLFYLNESSTLKQDILLHKLPKPLTYQVLELF